ncbi:hypothetical protein V8G21_001230 [Salmonella enterica]
MPDLMEEIENISALLHGEHGGVVLVILFLGLIFGVISMSILVISVIRCIFGAYQLLKRVVFRNRDSAFRTDAGTGRKCATQFVVLPLDGITPGDEPGKMALTVQIDGIGHMVCRGHRCFPVIS